MEYIAGSPHSLKLKVEELEHKIEDLEAELLQCKIRLNLQPYVPTTPAPISPMPNPNEPYYDGGYLTPIPQYTKG